MVRGVQLKINIQQKNGRVKLTGKTIKHDKYLVGDWREVFLCPRWVRDTNRWHQELLHLIHRTTIIIDIILYREMNCKTKIDLYAAIDPYVINPALKIISLQLHPRRA